MKVVALAVAGGGLYYALRPAALSEEEARAYLARGARILDVRTASEFAQGHVQGALHIPLDALKGRMTELEPKDRPILVYCASGLRSGRAKEFLDQAGFTSVRNIRRMSAWPLKP